MDEEISSAEMKLIEEGTNVLLEIVEKLGNIDDRLANIEGILKRPYRSLLKGAAS